MSATNSDARKRGWHRDETVDTQAVLAALDDDACRAILEATTQEALTATELSDRCDIPMSTAYRKVELLTDADLVEEQVRINTSGKHATEYATNFDDVHVSVGDDGFEIELTKPEGDAEAGSSYGSPAVADD
ncbi:helix-turn-helix domain-containing protein [Natrinema thermotolerans]|uniref:Helix-turn-helix domain-containing protein n=1 Tax=Natrinema thermotolerans TaxID=121872 RepID=A0AAF0PC15_9EURY|nr:helix-turn-helix domain-containing protein [Natrinema thermotolerans]ELZ11424.1 hypothetical protein C478_13475 [Natrinema thermotolerans DSM 11552]QCC58212.1 ArsR family transcriptional regulator [Natrinema thermotolerans]WMT09323.1 helix-turn-helix domain-containing protein [Natrinema thermotolerans]